MPPPGHVNSRPGSTTSTVYARSSHTCRTTPYSCGRSISGTPGGAPAGWSSATFPERQQKGVTSKVVLAAAIWRARWPGSVGQILYLLQQKESYGTTCGQKARPMGTQIQGKPFFGTE